jgi:acyl-CoA-dependent ceramide synthase
MQSSPYKSFNTQHFWLDYPHDAISPLTKAYYLVQISFWLQTLVVLNLEARRKDYFQMLGHRSFFLFIYVLPEASITNALHLLDFITVMLVSMSYILNFTRVGNAILVIMDLSDILLPVSTSSSSALIESLIRTCIRLPNYLFT